MTTIQENANHLSQDTKNRVLSFIETDKEYNVKLESFLTKHAEEIIELDILREKRNRELDDTEQRIRRDADLAPKDEVSFIKFGPFTALKKATEWFIPTTFIELAQRAGLYQQALDAGVIVIKTEIDRERANEFIRKNSVDKVFIAARDSKPLTTAISGPKSVPPFGAQLKKKQ